MSFDTKRLAGLIVSRHYRIEFSEPTSVAVAH